MTEISGRNRLTLIGGGKCGVGFGSFFGAVLLFSTRRLFRAKATK
jgi:hypothetical protein